jgi:hypothetical protein
MSEDKKPLFLTAIAKVKKLESKEVLAALSSHIRIYAPVEKVTLTSPLSGMDFPIIDLPIPEMYLLIILSKGAWEGNRIVNIEAGNEWTTEATFGKNIHLSIDDLFVYEHDLVDLEGRIPYLLPHSLPAPKSTGSRKDTTRINETRQECGKVTEELYQEKQTFDNDKYNWEPKLLSDAGRTTRGAYMDAVQNRLGETKLHRDTADDAWKAIPTDLKHQGRPPEQ